jgi:FkbM family methyltransferase
MLSREGLARRLNAHLLTLAPIPEETPVRRVGWQALLTPGRFDLAAKTIYARARQTGLGRTWATEVYREHLRVWGGFLETDGRGKDGFDAYLTAFDNVIDSISQDGFDPSTSVIPLDPSGGIIDGAHRAAACIVAQRDALAVELEYTSGEYDADRFGSMGLAEIYLDAMAIEYARLKANTRIVCLFPIALQYREKVEELIAGHGQVVYRKGIVFSGFGPQNLIAQLYRDEPWLGDREAGWPGSRSHARQRFLPDQPVVFYLVQFDRPQLAQELKERIRALCGVGNNAVHINDSHAETVRIAGQLFNPNSVDLLNRASLTRGRRTFDLHRRFLNELSARSLDPEDFCVDGSSVMSLYGIRDGNDFDFLTATAAPVFEDSLIACHNAEVGHYREPLEDLIYDPRLFLRYDDVKYVSLPVLTRMKMHRAEPKDHKDVASIENWGIATAKQACCELPDTRRNYARLKQYVRRIVPGRMRASLNAAFDGLRFSFTAVRRWPDYVQVHPRTPYREFVVAHGRGDSLVDRIRSGALYEPEVTRALLQSIQPAGPKALVVDVGANIGLVSLNLLSLLPSVRIHAFEPNATTFSFLRRTVVENGLDGRIELHPVALSRSAGKESYVVHGRRHSSGDGFRDTGRAGSSRQIEVRTTTLDRWWTEAGRPVVHAIKIDTEGAELWVLEGARALLTQHRPPIVLEVNADNLTGYEHGAEAIEAFLRGYGYTLRTLAGTEVLPGDLPRYSALLNDFVAWPPGRSP